MTQVQQPMHLSESVDTTPASLRLIAPAMQACMQGASSQWRHTMGTELSG
jgi:hypothetical protein